MADVYEVLFQVKPAAATRVVALDVATGKTAKGCSLEVVNLGNTVDYFDLTVDAANAGHADSQHIHYQVPVAPSLPFSRQAVIFVPAGGKMRFRSNNGNLAATLFGITS